jgi:hypothetical protein
VSSLERCRVGAVAHTVEFFTFAPMSMMKPRPELSLLEGGVSESNEPRGVLRLLKSGPLSEFEAALDVLDKALLRFSSRYADDWKAQPLVPIPIGAMHWRRGQEEAFLRDYMVKSGWHFRALDDLSQSLAVGSSVPALYIWKSHLDTCVLIHPTNASVCAVSDLGRLNNVNGVFVHRSWLPRP